MRNSIGCSIGIALLAVGHGAQAQVWEWQPRIEVGYEFDDNYRLDLPENEIEVSGAALDAQLKLSSAGQRTTWSLTPRLRSSYFPSQRSQDSDDYYVIYDLSHSGQKYTAGITAQYADETVVRSELPGFDPGVGLGGQAGADAGRVSIRNRRQLAEVKPAFHYKFSERRNLEIEARYLNIDFDQIAPQQIAYDNYGASVGFGFAKSPRTLLTLRVLADRYEPTDIPGEATSYGVAAEWAGKPSETTNTYVRIGGQQTDINRPALAGDATRSKMSYVAGIGGEWKTPLNTFFIDATHNIGANSSGFVVERDQLRLRWLRRLTERMDFISSLRGVRDTSLESDVGFARRTYADGNVGFRWRITRPFSLAATYDYTWQEFSDELADRKSQGVSLSVIYEPRRRD